ncbi:hypothetical protein EDD16DRAFT_1716879 [Pisolithus croceorrhizus]|nr:hypothetical protein EDD16DRAFT_1716879 [Pisolithus croceorrhizus]KAI6167167.1 hypothetical protein EDD17DRAFT_1752534 [Pisolithus thermaeus]
MSNQPSSSCQPTNTTSWDWTQVPDVDLRVHTSNSEGTEEAKEAKKEEAWLERECLEWEEHKKWEQEECERQEHEECEEKERWEALAVACQATVAEVEAAQQSVTKDKGRNAIKRKKPACFDGVEILAHHPQNAAPANPPPSNNPDPTTTSNTQPARNEMQAKSNAAKPSTSRPSSNPTPQFHYQSSFDKAAATKQLMSQVLEAKIEISTQDLLAVSPEIHKQIKEMAMIKKVVIGSLKTVLESSSSSTWASYEQYLIKDMDGKCVGLATAPLCAVDGVLMDKLQVKCILDSGCQVVALRHELWEALGAPLHSDMCMMLEAANQSKESTLAVIKNASL